MKTLLKLAFCIYAALAAPRYSLPGGAHYGQTMARTGLAIEGAR